MRYVVEEAKLVSSCFNWPSRANPLLSLFLKRIGQSEYILESVDPGPKIDPYFIVAAITNYLTKRKSFGRFSFVDITWILSGCKNTYICDLKNRDFYPFHRFITVILNMDVSRYGFTVIVHLKWKNITM